MASVISSVDAGLAPVIAQANAPPRSVNSKAAQNAAGSSPSSQDNVAKFVPAQPRYAEFAKLAKADDLTSEIAKSVREADKALSKVDDAVKQLQKEVLNVVKNFPPFPQNDERAQYLMSINGLRKELQAMAVPAVKDIKEPVFYPKEVKLPELDPKATSERELREYTDVLAQMEEGIKRGKAALKSAYEALPKKINQDMVIPLEGEAQASDVSRVTGSALQRAGTPLLAGETALAELET